jgi:hypothetical protein
VNPRKATTIKVELEKLLKVGFIYPVQLTQWVSNIVPKKGMIRVCMDLHDLKKDVQRIISPPHSLIILSMNAQAVRSFLSWMVFQDITRFRSNLKTDIKQLLSIRGAHLLIVRCLLA